METPPDLYIGPFTDITPPIPSPHPGHLTAGASKFFGSQAIQTGEGKSQVFSLREI